MAKTIYREEYRRLLAMMRERREAKGISQSAAARSLGWSQQKLSASEAGARRLDVLEFIELAAFLGLSPERAIRSARTAARATRGGSKRLRKTR